MSKYVLVLFIILLGCSYKQLTDSESPIISSQNPNSQERGNLDFRLLSSNIVDTNGIREKFDIGEEAPFTFFEQRQAFSDYLDFAFREYNLDLSVLDFDYSNYQDKFIAVTIGRNLVEIQYETMDCG